MEAAFPDAPPSDLRGRAVFEWMAGDETSSNGSSWELDFDLTYTKVA